MWTRTTTKERETKRSLGKTSQASPPRRAEERPPVLFVAFMEDTNGKSVNSTQEVTTLTNQHWTDTGPTEAEASKVAAEEEEAIKAEAPLEEEASKPEVHHLVKIIKIITKTNISNIMVHQQQSTLISRAMLHLATPTKRHRVATGMETNIIIIEMKQRPKLSVVKPFTPTQCFIGPVTSCLLLALRAKESHHTAET